MSIFSIKNSFPKAELLRKGGENNDTCGESVCNSVRGGHVNIGLQLVLQWPSSDHFVFVLKLENAGESPCLRFVISNNN